MNPPSQVPAEEAVNASAGDRVKKGDRAVPQEFSHNVGKARRRNLAPMVTDLDPLIAADP